MRDEGGEDGEDGLEGREDGGEDGGDEVLEGLDDGGHFWGWVVSCEACWFVLGLKWWLMVWKV